ncbi:MAG TPA: ABC transporter ATP-binding protein [Chloroflexota bacterium]|nr:ABC transporter ATP-binding protein [Chloroflexota bacterium]
MKLRQRWGTLRALAELAAMSFRADAVAAAVTATAQPFDLAGGVLQALALKGLADAAAGRDLHGAWVAGTLLALTTCGRSVAATGWTTARVRLRERAGMLMQRRLGELTAAIPTIEHFERPDYLRQMELVRQDSASLADLFSALVQQVSRFGRLALTVGLLAALHPALALLPLFGVPSLVVSAKAARIRRRLEEAVTEHRRLEVHLQSLAWDAWPGKEVRVFGLADELLQRHQRTRAVVDRLEDRESLKATLLTGAGWLVFAAGFVGAIAFVVAEAVAGRATVGDVVLALTLAGQVNGSVADLAATLGWASRSLAVAERYLWLTEYAARAAGSTMAPAPVPERLRRGITLEGISFTYPGTQQVVLAGVSVHLPAGSTVALVGENGAGKTTLVKLLLGLYEPTHGRLLLDGVDLRRLDSTAWRARTSAGFQDFARFMFLVRESVGAGDLPHVEDAGAVRAALERAHAGDVVAELPRGLETQLGRHFRTGVGTAAAAGLALSDGQWQKLALGRAMMRQEPLLLVLDEPTAALDAPSEHALFERYAGAARRVAVANGGITVLVSHRFSTVRMADLIVVLDGGRVAATGSHQELMARGGLYAELYELQARAYRG